MRLGSSYLSDLHHSHIIRSRPGSRFPAAVLLATTDFWLAIGQPSSPVLVEYYNASFDAEPS